MFKFSEPTLKRKQRAALERANQRKAQAHNLKAMGAVYGWNDHNTDIKGDK